MKQNNLYKVLFAVCIVLSVLAAVLSAAAVAVDYDPQKNYFSSNAPLFWAACITAAVAFAVGIAATVTTPHEKLSDTPFCNRINAYPTAVGFALALSAISLQEVSEPTSQLLIPFMVIALALSTAYSILSSIPNLIKNRPNLVAGIGLSSIASCLLLNIYLYFDLTVEMNAPLKLFVQIGLLCAMLYYTAELRYLLKIPMPRVFLLVGSATVSIGSLCAISLPVAFFTDKLPRFDYLACAVAVLAVIIVVIARMFALLNPKKDPIQPLSETIDTEPLDSQCDSNNEI